LEIRKPQEKQTKTHPAPKTLNTGEKENSSVRAKLSSEIKTWLLKNHLLASSFKSFSLLLLSTSFDQDFIKL
jgi:hypothetical protein